MTVFLCFKKFLNTDGHYYTIVSHVYANEPDAVKWQDETRAYVKENGIYNFGCWYTEAEVE